MVQTKAEVLTVVTKHRAIFRSLGVARIGLFGSFVRDEPTPKSDVDLLIEFLPGQKNFQNFMAVAELLEESTGRSVELVTPEALSPYIAPHIMQEIEYVAISS